VDLPVVHVGGMAIDLSITNSVASMIAGAIILIAFFALTARREIVPNRGQALAESLYNIIDRVLVGPIIGHGGKPYVPYILSLFLIILVLNLMSVVLAIGNVAGMEWTFAVTSQLAITGTLAVLTFFSVFILGFIKHGPKFLGLFFPSGMGVIGAILMAPIEMISYFVRPLTLALRLFGNMLGGHVAMKVFAGFVVSLGALAAGGGVALLGYPAAALALGGVVALTALEFLVAFLQAFVFAVLACVYLNDVVNLGHHH